MTAATVAGAGSQASDWTEQTVAAHAFALLSAAADIDLRSPFARGGYDAELLGFATLTVRYLTAVGTVDAAAELDRLIVRAPYAAARSRGTVSWLLGHAGAATVAHRSADRRHGDRADRRRCVWQVATVTAAGTRPSAPTYGGVLSRHGFTVVGTLLVAAPPSLGSARTGTPVGAEVTSVQLELTDELSACGGLPVAEALATAVLLV